MHTLMWWVPTEPSYYGPSRPSWKCEKCHDEHILFPGREWDYED